MAKGDYKKEFGGSKSGWEKGKKDTEKNNLIVYPVVVVATLILGVFIGKIK